MKNNRQQQFPKRKHCENGANQQKTSQKQQKTPKNTKKNTQTQKNTAP
jgi:hypothetical protein